MIVSRVEKHIIHKNHQLYNMFLEYGKYSKNLYNYTLYYLRQLLIQKSKIKDKKINENELSQDEIDKLNEKYMSAYSFCTKEKNSDVMKSMHSQVSQQIVQLVYQNWDSFFKANNDYNKNPQKYLGRPKLPKYLDKNGMYMFKFTNQACKHKENYIQFPKVFNKYKLNTKICGRLKEVRVLPRNEYFILEIVFDKEIIDCKKNTNKKLSIDLGLNNLLAVANNFNEQPIIVNGKGLKSVNQYYNKRMSFLQSKNPKQYTNRMNRLTIKRNNKVIDLVHKISRFITDYANQRSCDEIIIGYNKEWKQNINIGKKNNQKFIGIPYLSLINKISYKCEEVGIKVTLTEESYTSGTSFIDGELPQKEYYNKNRRKHRGLFISNNGIKINADINGAFQIMNKVSHYKWVEGLVLNPIKINIF